MNIITKVKNKIPGVKEEPIIEFIAKEEYIDAVPEPTPAHKYIPTWYKESDTFFNEDGTSADSFVDGNHMTVKRCMPFLEALTLGWILPNSASVFIKNKSELTTNVDFEYVVPHPDRQIKGYGLSKEQTLLKFDTPWYVKAPKNTRLLITPPMNRKNDVFQPFYGVRQIDGFLYQLFVLVTYNMSEENVTIPDGDPLAQMIFFNENGIINEGIVRPMTNDEITETKRVKHRMDITASYYKHKFWDPLPASRNIPSKKDTSSKCPFFGSEK